MSFYGRYSPVGGGGGGGTSGIISINADTTPAQLIVGGTGINVGTVGGTTTITSTSQPAGNYITALTGDVAATGPGSVAASLIATSNSTLTSLSALTTAGSLATIGTITSGIWNSTAIGAQYGGTGGNSSASTGIAHVSSGTWSYSAVNLASSDVTGTLAIANGGTGATSTSQNFAFIGPTSGSGAPSFRALVAGDIPSLSGTYLPLAGGTMAGAIAMGTNNITGINQLTFNNGSGKTLSIPVNGGNFVFGGFGGVSVTNSGTSYAELFLSNTSSGAGDWSLYSMGSGQADLVGAFVMRNQTVGPYAMAVTAFGSCVAFGNAADGYAGRNITTLTVAPLSDKNATGTTTANASTTITGSGTSFLKQIAVGDKIALSSASSTFATVTARASNTSLTVDSALGNGTSQTISIRRAVQRWDDKDATPVALLSSAGRLQVGDVSTLGGPQAKLEVSNMSEAVNIVRFMDNTTAVFTIADGGNITATGTFASGGIVGNTAGSAIASGLVGEFLSARGTSSSVSNASQTSIVTLTLTTGVWLVAANYNSDSVVTQTGYDAYFYQKGSTASNQPADLITVRYAAAQSGACAFSARVLVIASGDSDKTIEIKAQSVTATGAGYGYLAATRIA